MIGWALNFPGSWKRSEDEETRSVWGLGSSHETRLGHIVN